MRRKKHQASKKIFIVLFLAAFGVSAAVAYEYFFKPETKTPTPANQPTAPVTPSNTPDTPTTPSDNNKKVTPYEGENPNASESLGGNITYAGPAGDNLMIRVDIDQYVSGTCWLTLSNGGTNYEATVNLIADVSTSTCAGFDIPLNNLTSGHYNINIRLTAGDKTGTITGEVDI
jgi:hypothetical protein